MRGATAAGRGGGARAVPAVLDAACCCGRPLHGGPPRQRPLRRRHCRARGRRAFQAQRIRRGCAEGKRGMVSGVAVREGDKRSPCVCVSCAYGSRQPGRCRLQQPTETHSRHQPSLLSHLRLCRDRPTLLNIAGCDFRRLQVERAAG